jgi:transposase
VKVSGKMNRRKYDADYNASVNIARRDLALLAGLCNPASGGLEDEPTELPTSVVE